MQKIKFLNSEASVSIEGIGLPKKRSLEFSENKKELHRK
jgi:hypothetical protein